MIISIIVPYHKETYRQIQPLLRSINEQIGINFNNIEIIMSCDVKEGNKDIDFENFNEFENIKDRIHKIKSQQENNPGVSRQTAIDYCAGDYVFFCDADDSLFHYGVLRELFDNIKNSGADVYRFKFMEEIGVENASDRWYVTKDYDWIWVFAKAYKVDFLRKNHIKFNPENRWHEDSYFNMLVKYCDPKVIDVESLPAYLWRYRNDTITRFNNHEYTFDSAGEYIEAIGRAFHKIINDYKKDCYIDIVKVIVNYYFVFQNPDNLNKEKYEDNEKCYYEFVKKYLPKLFIETDNIDELQKLIGSLMYNINGLNYLPEQTLKQYLKYLKKKY